MVRLLRLGLVAGTCALSACQAPASAPPPPVEEGPDFASAIHIDVDYAAEASAVHVEAKLEPGYHVYAPGESVGRPIAIALAEGSGWKSAGEAHYPAGEPKETSLGKSVVVEGALEASLPVEAAKEEPGKITGTFAYQVCTDTACDRPRKLPFELDAAPAE